MFDWIEIQFWKIAKVVIRRGYGCNCATKDTDDMPEHPKALNWPGRCASCAAKEVIEWIDGHIDLLKS